MFPAWPLIDSTGRIDQVVQAQVSNHHLALVGSKAGLDDLILINPAQATVSTGVMAQTVEAILGAVYLDSKMDVQAVRAVMALLGLGWPVWIDAYMWTKRIGEFTWLDICCLPQGHPKALLVRDRIRLPDGMDGFWG
jgi:hypothetical protein